MDIKANGTAPQHIENPDASKRTIWDHANVIISKKIKIKGRHG
jgi:hypothetical protein